MSSSPTEFEQSIIQFFQDAAEILGAPRSLAAIYGVIFASPSPLCFADIETKLGLSKGSVSQGLKALKSIGAIKSTEHPGDRREWFEPDMELRKMVRRFIETRLEHQLAQGTQRLKTIKSQIPQEKIQDIELLTERVEHLENWHGKAKGVIPVVKTLLVLSGN